VTLTFIVTQTMGSNLGHGGDVATYYAAIESLDESFGPESGDAMLRYSLAAFGGGVCAGPIQTVLMLTNSRMPKSASSRP
jgi:hypothetical protein